MFLATKREPFIAGASLRGAASAFVSVLAVASLAGCATAEPYNPGRLASDQLAQIGQTCESVLRVHRGEQHYDACVESLSESLSSARQVDPAPRSLDGGSSPAVGVSTKSYFYASADELHRREQVSCARLGLDGAQCVADLEATLAGIDSPPD